MADCVPVWTREPINGPDDLQLTRQHVEPCLEGLFEFLFLSEKSINTRFSCACRERLGGANYKRIIMNLSTFLLIKR